MTRTGACKVCQHPKCAEIEGAVAAGGSLRKVAATFGIDKDCIARHTRKHLAQTLASAAAARETVRGESLLAQLEGQRKLAAEVYEAARKVLKRAERRRDPASMIAAIRASAVALGEMRATIELYGRMSGSTPRPPGASTTVNVAVAVAGTEAGGPLVAKLSALIAGVRERQLPADTEPARAAGEVEGEVIIVEQAR